MPVHAVDMKMVYAWNATAVPFVWTSFFFCHDKNPKWSLSLYNATVLRYENCLCLKNRSCWNQFCWVWFGFCLNCPPRWSSLGWKCLPPHWTAHNGLCFLWVPQHIFSKLKGTVSLDCRPCLCGKQKLHMSEIWTVFLEISHFSRRYSWKTSVRLIITVVSIVNACTDYADTVDYCTVYSVHGYRVNPTALFWKCELEGLPKAKITCPQSRWLCGHANVELGNRIYLRKGKNYTNRFSLIIWGLGRVFSANLVTQSL